MPDVVSELVCEAALRQRFEHLDRFARIYLAISGGSDSCGLLQLVAAWLSQTGADADRVCILTVDHGLRERSASEARFVHEQAFALGLRQVTLEWSGEKPTSGVQEAARNARYRLMTEFAKQEGDDCVIVTAHTKDDQAETVLMRLGRGSGVDGLAAIPATSDMNGVPISRPLLDVSRESLVSVLESKGDGWIVDPSNDASRFERVRIRKARRERETLGLTDDALARTAARMARAHSALDAIVRGNIRKELAEARYTRFGVFEWTERCTALDAECAIRLLRRYIQVAAGQMNPPELGQVEAIYEQTLRPGFTGATLHGCRLVPTERSGQQTLFLFREEGREPLPRVSFAFTQPLVWDHRFLIVPRTPQQRCLTVGPLDLNARRQLQEEGDLGPVAELPTSILPVQPAVFDEALLVAAPSIGWSAKGFDCTAQFLVNNLFTKAGFGGP